MKREDNNLPTRAKEETEGEGKEKKKRGWKTKQTCSSIFS
jgi:hypothetical protein